MNEFEFFLQDRIGVIRSVDSKYDLRKNAYLSFSGGKDSTILHYLLDMALPGNEIPRVFMDTGIEFFDIRAFVLGMAEHDKRFVILRPSMPIKSVLDKYGYPFKSKEHSKKVDQYFKSKVLTPSLRAYVFPEVRGRYSCPEHLIYQFEPSFSLHISHMCCHKLKKEPAHKWAKSTGKSIILTGMRKAEGGQRANIKGCVLTDKDGNVVKFHPLLVVSDSWEDDFIAYNHIGLCRLYSEPFYFKRTGCKGCPFALGLQEELTTMELYLPAERKQCEYIWKPVYDEYRRLNYRLDRNEQLRLF